jgi:hypothetical protein
MSAAHWRPREWVLEPADRAEVWQLPELAQRLLPLAVSRLLSPVARAEAWQLPELAQRLLPLAVSRLLSPVARAEEWQLPERASLFVLPAEQYSRSEQTTKQEK